MFGPILDGARVRLTPATPDMLPAFCRWFADPDVTRYMTLHYPPSPAMEQEWFDQTGRSETDVHWAVVLPDQADKLIGAVGIHAISWRNRRAVTGTVFGDKSEWGKGYASEAIRLRTEWAFGQMGLEKLTTKVFVENVASRRALEKAGYRTVGIARRDEWWGGKWHDLWLGEVLRDEWQQQGR